MEQYKVFVLADESDRVIAINSSAFLTDVSSWIQIDEGTGDKFHHAQNNYLPGPLYDNHGISRYKLIDGSVAERTPEEMDADYVPPEPQLTAEELLAALMEGIANA